MWSFIFFIMGLAAAVGMAIGFLIVVPSSVYMLPYMTWLYWNRGSKGIPKEIPSEKNKGIKFFSHNVKNATKLYCSWINKQPHNITDW